MGDSPRWVLGSQAPALKTHVSWLKYGGKNFDRVISKRKVLQTSPPYGFTNYESLNYFMIMKFIIMIIIIIGGQAGYEVINS